jgi:arylsulfatase A-like enzyme
VLISVDTLRADHLSLYGYHRRTSPNLDALASASVVFDRFVNNGGGTLPSHLTMMTSLHPRAHGVSPYNGRSLAQAEITLAESLRAAGYATAAFVDAGWMKARFGFAQGFDLYDDGGGHLEILLPKALRWLERHADRRFFLFLHTYDVHSEPQGLPYDCPSPFPSLYATSSDSSSSTRQALVGGSRLLADWNAQIVSGARTLEEILEPQHLRLLVDLYDGCINYVDTKLAELLGWLERRKLFDGALIIITSDHGEEFGEHGMLMHAQGSYEEFARIPLLIKLPRSAAIDRVDGLAAMVDLVPTILDIAGLELSRRAQGRSLVPSILQSRGVRSSTHFGDGIRTATHKYIRSRRQLFDLSGDPGETLNLADSQRALVERMERELETRLREDLELHDGGSGPATRLSADELRELEALGYLGSSEDGD